VSVLPIRFVDVNVTDLDRSVDFYTRHLELPVIDTPHLDDDEAWLDGGAVVVRLHRRVDGTPSRWIADDLQLGFRHFGFAVTGLDERAELLHEAGVRVHPEPLDATGKVRITFFFDPDGVLLEFIQGRLDHHKVWNADIVDEVQSRRAPPRPTFDHVAMTVRDLDATVDDVAGRLVQQGATPVAGSPCPLLLDRDGFPLRIEE
jgi:catechol 2,3-dioxygenase-like lactoylglutathione lyase family enzyme